ncbi:MAG: hypothetical protein PHX14_03800 [Syntrophomonadaceae bacterium]|nr:hypothetical protein [Syntrophomonadaceae bacterium]
MEKKFKKVLVGMLVMSMLVGGVFSAQADTRDAEAETGKSKAVVAQGIMTSPPMSDIQYQKFIAYLTQEYAPELKAEWEKAFADRAGITLPVPSDLPANVKITGINKMGNIKFGTVTVTAKNSDKTGPNAEVEASEIYMSFAQNPGDKLDPGTDVISATEVKPGANCVTITFPQENDEHFTEQMKLQDELDKAITSNDGNAIKKVLGKMLTNYKENSEDMKSALSKVEITTSEK